MPTFVVYHGTSLRIVNLFDTAAGAKRSCTCLNRNAGNNDYRWASYDDFCTNISPELEQIDN